MACKTMTLTEFVHHYEQRAAEMRDIEAMEDFKCRGIPKLAIEDCGILKHAATLYTRTIFTRFQLELLQKISKKVIINVEMNGTSHTYTILKGESGHFETVQFNSMDNSISCSCLMFESLGWLCCHVLKVLFLKLNFSYIPAQHIMKRWTKTAKQGNEFEEYNKKKTPASSMAIRLNRLMKESFAVMTLAENDVESEEITRKYLHQARVETTKVQTELYVKGTHNNCPKSSTSAGPSSGIHDQVWIQLRKRGNEMDRED
ncbi:protein FAR1-RELATED SEQUENCE 9-like [Lycium ferocissimum]|uniref:protein FAR1-RELATED SEQUENCE 9-like n=1 Tax=Lycium ferocissimum TaxID=112874 RepID=UPI00281631BB|nr:protein FAR1-RELATED SEQUENCE 9-like [Lycium ferocissimum]